MILTADQIEIVREVVSQYDTIDIDQVLQSVDRRAHDTNRPFNRTIAYHWAHHAASCFQRRADPFDD